MLAGGRRSMVTRTLVQRIHDNKDRKLSREFEHAFETLCKDSVAGLFGAIAIGGVQLIKNIPTTIRTVAELKKKGCQQATEIALGSILDIEIIVRDQYLLSLLHVLDVFDHGRTSREDEPPISEICEKPRTKE
jgi:hypothetical protein